jgi:flavin reductase (DIM6/NTAB) family NADH-FMN oxidoreductase RutF
VIILQVVAGENICYDLRTKLEGAFFMKKLVKKGTSLFPVPAVMVSCASENTAPNIITVAWAGVVCSEPPIVSISVRPGRHSHGQIKKSGEFVINIPREDQLRALDFCGVASGRNTNKFGELGLTPVAGSEVSVPLIKECPVNIECRVVDMKTLGTHDLFLGEIVAVHMDEEVLSGKGIIDINLLRPIAYCPQASEYWSLKEAIGTYGFTGGKKP